MQDADDILSHPWFEGSDLEAYSMKKVNLSEEIVLILFLKKGDASIQT